MARDRQGNGTPPETVISIIGPGMKVVGDCDTDGTIRIEGTVEGTVRAGKAVVVGKDGFVEGTVITQDAVISGRIVGRLSAESRLELQATSRIEGEVHARRMQLEEGALLNGTVHVGDEPKRLPEAADLEGQVEAERLSVPTGETSEHGPEQPFGEP